MGLDQGFSSGAWLALDAVLSWINTQDEQLIDKSRLYKAVMEMRPGCLVPLRPEPEQHQLELDLECVN